jgi:hypothetical protein
MGLLLIDQIAWPLLYYHTVLLILLVHNAI